MAFCNFIRELSPSDVAHIYTDIYDLTINLPSRKPALSEFKINNQKLIPSSC